MVPPSGQFLQTPTSHRPSPPSNAVPILYNPRTRSPVKSLLACSDQSPGGHPALQTGQDGRILISQDFLFAITAGEFEKEIPGSAFANRGEAAVSIQVQSAASL
jgi:hypothetical protein